MNVLFLRFLSLLLVSLVLLPLLAGCGKSEKAMQAPDGLSNRQRRDQKQATPPGP